MADDSTPPSRPTVEHALELLRGALADAIRAEQLRDRLTGLANDEALSEWIQTRTDTGRAFWIAFVEVDRFKSINDKYGYDDADLLLKKIAGQLAVGAGDFFPDGALPVRAHGDEFFLVGDLHTTAARAELIGAALDQVRRSISTIRLTHRGRADPMTCTVSIGWLLSSDLLGTGLTPRSVRHHLELSVARAKVTRNATVRFSPEMTKKSTAEGRSDCPSCRAKFTVTVEADQLLQGPLRCPNCSGEVERPHSLANHPRADFTTDE